ncbi:MAG: hypothetical protein LBD62_05305 [Candidatus Margulisbacteria bacterium]|nr:hypothetical protein [Candidatus Margulisiibacteriota bacterium]
MQRKYIQLVDFKITSFDDLVKDVAQIIPEVWEYYKSRKVEAATGRPVGDNDYTFSETVSYVLFRAVSNGDRVAFDKTWQWAYNNLLRSNLREVYFANDKRKGRPTERVNNLFSWRFAGANSPFARQTGYTGIINYKWDEDHPAAWFDGYDAAPDGDVLIAYSLLLADQKWGSGRGAQDYKGWAAKIIPDIWENCVVKGQLGGSAVPLKFENIWDNNENADYRILNNGQQLEITYLNKEPDNPRHNKHSGIWGRSNLGLKNFGETYDSITLKINSDRNCLSEILFQVDKNEDYGAEVQLKLGENVIQIPMAKISKRNHDSWKYEDANEEHGRIPNNTTIANFAIQCRDLKNTKLIVSDVWLQRKQQSGRAEERYYLSSNDKRDIVFNLSYFMPFAYKAFATEDKDHDWLRLFDDSYKTIDDALNPRVMYKDSRGDQRVYHSNGALVPDWNAFTVDGIASAYGTWPSFSAGTIADSVQDTNLSSWDAMRVYLWAAYDYVQTGDTKSKALLEKAGRFFTQQLNTNNWIANAYNVDGTLPPNNRRGALDKGTPFGMGIALGVFAALDDKANAMRVYSLLKENYKDGNFCAETNDYFTSNIIAFALDIFRQKYGVTVPQISVSGNNPVPLSSAVPQTGLPRQSTPVNPPRETIPVQPPVSVTVARNPVTLRQEITSVWKKPVTYTVTSPNILAVRGQSSDLDETSIAVINNTNGAKYLVVKARSISGDFPWGGQVFGLKINNLVVEPENFELANNMVTGLQAGDEVRFPLAGVDNNFDLKLRNYTGANFELEFWLEQ